MVIELCSLCTDRASVSKGCFYVCDSHLYDFISIKSRGLSRNIYDLEAIFQKRDYVN